MRILEKSLFSMISLKNIIYKIQNREQFNMINNEKYPYF